MPSIQASALRGALLPFALVVAAFAPPASACTQPLGIGPEEPDSAMQSVPMAFDEGATIGYGHNSA